MNTNMKELSLNEMEQINGGDFFKTVGAEMVLQINTELQNPLCMGRYDPYPWVVGGIGGLCKGVWKGIFGE